MKRIAFISILLSILCFGCGEKNNDPLQSIEGIRWKLVGLVYETGTLEILEPTDCKECYTLVWSIDDKATVHIMNGQTWILDMYNLTPGYLEFRMYPELYPIYGEYYDNCWSFCSFLAGTESYTKTAKELKLYCIDSNKKRYLLFKPF